MNLIRIAVAIEIASLLHCVRGKAALEQSLLRYIVSATDERGDRMWIVGDTRGRTSQLDAFNRLRVPPTEQVFRAAYFRFFGKRRSGRRERTIAAGTEPLCELHL